MKSFHSILVIVPSKSSPPQLRRFIRNSIILGQRLRSELHFFSNESEAAPLEDTIADFKTRYFESPSTLVIRATTEEPVAEILDVIHKHSCNLILMQDSVILNQTKGFDERQLLEQSPVPVFLMPREADLLTQPPNAFLAPLSGEQRRSEAAALALTLAEQAHSPVDFLHVTTPNKSCTCDKSMEALGDQLHHEYQQMVEKVASEASPYSTPEERSRIRHFYHCSGFTTEEIVNVLARSSGTILVLEWKGTFAPGRAETIKSILAKTRHPILFVRVSEEEKSTLRVGRHLRVS